jgi:ribosomal protein S18 acetylase RimI-like enzyme
VSTEAIRPDPWLAALFERDVFRIEASSDSGRLAGLVDQHCQQRSHAFYYAKVDAIDVPTVTALTSAGMAVVEVNVTFGVPAAAHRHDADLPTPVAISAATASDAEALLTVAATSFRYSRFHLDPLVPNALANRIKREWIASYLVGRRGECLWAVRSDGDVAGFLAVTGGDDHGGRYKTIDLIAVAPAFQGRGIGRQVLRFFFRHYAHACEHLRVGTQVANLPSMRLYESASMRVERAQYVLHMHVPESRR